MVDRGVRGLFAALTKRDDSDVLYECRRCGRTLDPADESCPLCQSEEIERFVI